MTTTQQNLDQLLHKGLALHQAGKLAEAGEIYNRVLALDPADANALHLLGIIAIQRGDPDNALELIRQAIAIKPAVADYRSSLGNALQLQRKLDDAVAAWRLALSLDPALIEPHINLGNVLWEMGRFDESVAASKRALELDPKSVKALNNLGNALRSQGLMDESIEAYRRAIRAAGGLQANEIGIAKVPLHLAPDFAMACFNLAETQRSAAANESVFAAYRAAIEANPKFIEAHAGLAIALASVQRFDEAMASYAQAAAIAPNSAITHEALGEIKLHSLKAEEAVECFRKAVAADPNRLAARQRLCRALETLGRFEEAEKCSVPPSEDQSGVSVPTGKDSGDAAQDAEVRRLLSGLHQPNLSIDERIGSEFALGKILDEADRFDEAFPHFAEGNALVKRQRAMAGETYDRESFRRRIDQMIETFTADFFQQRRQWGDPSILPVFIVGMPRSGTTLVHQIAASHPEVHGGGEMRLAGQIETEFGQRDKQADCAGWTREKVSQAAQTYLGYLRALNPTASRIVDKMPGNVLRLGMIGLLFPNVKIILCRRDARDICLSCFFQNFGSLNFSFDLADCGRYHVETDRLAAHWLKVRPAPILEMQYETLVGDLEGQSRRLIDFLGLPWDPACLEFYRAKTAVLTASIRQVRKPIYQKSVARWRHYEKHLTPLFEALGPDYTKT